MASIFTVTVPASTPAASVADIDEPEVRRALALFADPDGGIQLQEAPYYSFATFPGCEITNMVTWLQSHLTATGLYYTLNVVPPDLDHSVKVSDVVRRRWLLVDVDRFKTKENKEFSATEGEHASAQNLAAEVRDWLAEREWPTPLLVDSGNGYHLLYRVDLPNDDASRNLLRGFLVALAGRFDCRRGGIGKECHDARRISKLPGTWARRGPNSPERPHRLTRLIYVGDRPQVVPHELIRQTTQELGGAAQETPKESPRAYRKEPASIWTQHVGDSQAKAWAKAALESECSRMALTPVGGLNAQLFRSGAAMGNIVGAGLLKEEEVFHALLEAGRSAGCDYPKKDEGTLRRAIKHGTATPRDASESASGNGKRSNGKIPPENSQTPSSARWRVTLDDRTILEGDPKEILPELNVGSDGLMRHFDLRTLGSLLRKDYPEPNWIIPGVMSEGLNILAGAPKMGKSILALNIALTVAAGGKALGNIQVDPADVLYLSLEDKQRRLKTRALKMIRRLAPGAVPVDPAEHLTIATEWPRQDEGGLNLIEVWRKAARRPGLIIIDVWNRFGPRHEGRKSNSAYSQDADDMAVLKTYADQHGMAALAIHHTRKPGIHAEDHDHLLEVSGTLGLTGTADGIMVLLRARQKEQAQFHIIGRDVSDAELILEFDPETLTWKSMGTAADHLKGEVQQSIIKFLRTRGDIGASAPEIAEGVKQKQDSVRRALNRMLIERIVTKRGNVWKYPFGEDDAEETVAAGHSDPIPL